MTGETTEELASYWSASLASWAIPEEILARAPTSPWEFPVGLFAKTTSRRLESAPDTPSFRRALEAIVDADREIGQGGVTVLDVGCGAGAASLPLLPPARRLVAVDERPQMLASLTELAAARHIEVDTIAGRWPDVAEATPAADVVVCHHVLYNVADLIGFVKALDAHARKRVVVEITGAHPLSHLNELWRVIHGIVRPDRPVATDAAALIRSLGFAPRVERFARRPSWEEGDRRAEVALARQHLCVGPERDQEIDALLGDEDRELVTISWDTAGRVTG
jgi:SAM-dependent methyltransferase